MAKVEATKSYGATVGARRRGASRTRSRPRSAYVEETGATFVHPFEDERVIAGQGTIGLELAEQVPQAETVVDPGRRRRPRRRDRDRAAGGASRRSGSSACRRAASPTAFTIADGIAVKQPGELTGRDPRRRCSTTSSTVDRRGDLARRSCCCSSARSSSSRAPARSALAALLAGQGRAARGRRWRPLGRQHRPDAADLGDAPRAHHRGALPRRAHAALRDRPGELLKLLDLVAARARQRRLGRPPPRGHGHAGRRDRGRADADDARRARTAPCCSKRCAASATPSSGCAKGDARLRRVRAREPRRRELLRGLRDASRGGAAGSARGAQGRHRPLRRPRRLHRARRAARPGGRACACSRRTTRDCAASSSGTAAPWRSSSATR